MGCRSCGLVCVLGSGLLLGRLAPAQSPVAQAPLDRPPIAEQAVADDGVRQVVDLSSLPSLPNAEADDGARSLALFAQGQLLKRHGDYPAALSAFQRAWFWQPHHRKLLDEIVPLAFMLDRHESAVHYALLAAELEPDNPELIGQLAEVLIERGEYARAVELIEAGLNLLPPAQPSAEGSEESGTSEMELATPVEGGATDAETVADLRIQLQQSLFKACFLGGLDEPGIPAVRTIIRIRRADLESATDPRESEIATQQLVLAYTVLGELQRQAGAYADAREAFEDAWRLDKDDSTWRYWQAELAFNQGDTATARQQLDEYFDNYPWLAGLSALELLQQLVAPDALLPYLQSRFEQHPDDRSLTFFLADHYLAGQDVAAARELVATLHHQQPTLDTYQRLLQCDHRLGAAAGVMAHLGQLIELEGDLSSVSTEVKEIVQDPGFLDQLIKVGRQRGDNEARPLLAREAQALAMVMFESHRWPLADEFLVAAIQRSKPDERLLLLQSGGLQCLAHERYAEAVALFQRAADSSPDPELAAESYYYLATALALADEHDRALEAIDAAIAADPDSILFATRRAWILSHARRYEESIDAYQAVIDHFQHDVNDMLQSARISLAALVADQGDFERAESQLLEVLAHDPLHMGAKNDLGYLWTDHDQHLHRARQLIEDAVAEDPDNAAYRDSQGWVYFKLGDVDRAIECLEQAAASDDPDGVILDHLGDAYQTAGRTDEARKTWKAACEAFRESEQLDKMEVVEAKLDSRK